MSTTRKHKKTAISCAAKTPSKKPFKNNERDDYALEGQVGHLLRRAHQRHLHIFFERLNAHKLTAMKWAVLVKLRDEEEASQNRLGRLAAMDPATVQGVVKGLAERGLIIGRLDPTDGRRNLWRLSAAGKRLLKKLMPVAEHISELTLSPLTEAQQKTFLSLLRKIS